MGLTRAQIKSSILSLIEDNTNELISPQDIRDSFDYVIDNLTSRKEDLYSSYAGVTAGSGNDYTFTDSDEYPGSYTEGKIVVITADRANTGAATINGNANGAKDWKNANGGDMTSGDISAGGIYGIVYDSSADYFITIYGLGALQTAAVTVVENATASQTISSIPGIYHYTSSATEDGTWTMPEGSSDLVGKSLEICNNSDYKITVSRAGSDTFSGGDTSITIYPGQWAYIRWSGTIWLHSISSQ